MDKMVNVYLFGKKYSVPAELTIMRAMEYAGYQLVRGCGPTRLNASPTTLPSHLKNPVSLEYSVITGC